MTEEQRGKDGIKEGLKAGMGILSALREAIEETVDEMRERGDITPDRAKEAVRTTMKKAQDAMGDARERLDFVQRKEFDTLKAEVAELRQRLAVHEGGNNLKHELGSSSSTPPHGDPLPGSGPATSDHYAPGLAEDATPAGGHTVPGIDTGTRSGGAA